MKPSLKAKIAKEAAESESKPIKGNPGTWAQELEKPITEQDKSPSEED